jgi:hypothetical protein
MIEIDGKTDKGTCWIVGKIMKVPLAWAGRVGRSDRQNRRSQPCNSVGQCFYDTISAEYFVMQSGNMAAMVTGAGDGPVADEFDVEDVVGVERTP